MSDLKVCDLFSGSWPVLVNLLNYQKIWFMLETKHVIKGGWITIGIRMVLFHESKLNQIGD